jgi:hypothetical protein
MTYLALLLLTIGLILHTLGLFCPTAPGTGGFGYLFFMLCWIPYVAAFGTLLVKVAVDWKLNR